MPVGANYAYACAWLLSILGKILVCIWYWKLAQIFGFYERGLIFSSEIIRRIKFLGLLCAIQWMLGIVFHMLLSHFMSQEHLKPSAHVAADIFRGNFFSFGFSDMDFGLLLAGVIIVLVAWIMDEGRKIQEEQELTV